MSVESAEETVLPLRHEPLWRAGGWLLVLSVVIGSLAPGGQLPSGMMNDKLLHFGAYLAMTFWFTGIYRRRRYGYIAAGLLLLGLALELLQMQIAPSRSGSAADLLANAGGIGGGIALALAGLGGWCGRLEAWLAAAGGGGR